jgi:hypothetical protein
MRRHGALEDAWYTVFAYYEDKGEHQPCYKRLKSKGTSFWFTFSRTRALLPELNFAIWRACSAAKDAEGVQLITTLRDRLKEDVKSVVHVAKAWTREANCPFFVSCLSTNYQSSDERAQVQVAS